MNFKLLSEAEKIMDEQYPMWCPCGRLATGLHTQSCRKWRDGVKRIYARLEKEEKK